MNPPRVPGANVSRETLQSWLRVMFHVKHRGTQARS